MTFDYILGVITGVGITALPSVALARYYYDRAQIAVHSSQNWTAHPLYLQAIYDLETDKLNEFLDADRTGSIHDDLP